MTFHPCTEGSPLRDPMYSIITSLGDPSRWERPFSMWFKYPSPDPQTVLQVTFLETPTEISLGPGLSVSCNFTSGFLKLLLSFHIAQVFSLI